MQDPQTLIKKSYIKSGEISDFNQIVEIENELKLPKTNLKLFTNLIMNENIIVLKSYATNQILAFLQFQGDIEELEIIGLGVKKQYQNNGLGKKILNHVINKGYRKIFLEVSKINTVALELYYSLGFKKISIRKNYFSSKYNTKEDALVLNLINKK